MYQRTHTSEGHTTTCRFHMSTLRRAGGWEARDVGGCGGGGGRDGGGNLTQSCVLGMTSLGGRAEVRCLGIAFAAGIGGRNES